MDTPDGPFWQAEGRQLSPSGRKASGYIRSEDHGFRPGRPESRLEGMDRDGVHTQVIYSTRCGSTTQRCARPAWPPTTTVCDNAAAVYGIA